jgi:phage-related tail protein
MRGNLKSVRTELSMVIKIQSRFALLLGLSLIAGAGAAEAQSAQSLSVQEIQQCLCMQPKLQPLQDAWLASQKDFDEHQRQLDAINQEVTAQRARLNPEDTVGQQVLKDLMSQQQGLRDQVSSVYRPAVNKARNAYNDAVMQYNGLCTRPRYSVDEAKARQGLVCIGQ